MQEVKIKTHLIIKDIHSEYDINWCGKFQNAHPVFVNDKPVFILMSAQSRVKMNTWDMSAIEKIGKKMAEPRGREAITEGVVRVYLKEEDNKYRFMCVITHRKIKTFAPMYDKMGWRE